MNTTLNHEGNIAYILPDKERLMTTVMTTFLSGDKFYGSTKDQIVELAEKICDENIKFVSNLAIYARVEFNMRSVSHLLMAIIARKMSGRKNCFDYLKITVLNACLRADDILHVFEQYKELYGKPFPNRLKNLVGEVISSFGDYGIAKYSRKNNGTNITFKDVIRLSHPKGKDIKTTNLFHNIMNDSLPIPKTWETELSEKGNIKEVWNDLIHSNSLGYMASLRNLRNIANTGADIDAVLKLISDKDEVKKSKQLPFRYLSAYIETMECDTDGKIERALNTAIRYSIENMKKIPGRSLIAIDQSGSMCCPISRKSKIASCNIATLLGYICAEICEQYTIVHFAETLEEAKYQNGDNILRNVMKNSSAWGGTNMELPIIYALDNREDIYDRIIYFSDNECNRWFGAENVYHRRTGCQSLVNRYRRELNQDLFVHCIDTEGQGTVQFDSNPHNTIIGGWSEKTLEFINMSENGMGSMVKTIEDYIPSRLI